MIQEEPMPFLSTDEKILKWFMLISALMYLIAGTIFIVAPQFVLKAINSVAGWLQLGLKEIPVHPEAFWVTMTFSMMMTITVLSLIAFANIRRNQGFIVPLCVAKLTSSLSSMAYFILAEKYFAYLVIFAVDGFLFVVTLGLYLRAKRARFHQMVTSMSRKYVPPKPAGETKVAAIKHDDKFRALDEVLAKTNFFELLQQRFVDSGHTEEEFSVVIKPNFMFAYSKKDYSTYTDPELVEYLVHRIVEKGFTNIAIVEAQSTYGNYYKNRDVLSVAKHVGYSTEKNYRIVDLTLEKEPYDYGGLLGQHVVGKTWRDGDFRVSFAKNKTHCFCYYTLTLKNVYGALPMQNKLKEYHVKREYDWPTIESLKHFPVHYGLIDAFTSADGPFGVITCPNPKHTKTIIGGESLIAVDWVGAVKMGLDPNCGRFVPLAVEAFGMPKVEWIGDQSQYQPWENVSPVLVEFLDEIEEAYALSDWFFSVATVMDEAFPFKPKALIIRALKTLIAPIQRIFFRYGKLMDITIKQKMDTKNV